MKFDAVKLARPNIRRLKPYSSARSEFSGAADVWLDANENAFGSPAGGALNRYPDPLQSELRRKIASANVLSASQVFVGNGSDEAIDLLLRIFCQPGHDEVLVCTPTYGMYSVLAAINDVGCKGVPLTDEFQLNPAAISAAISERTKLIFLCSPNNPTGNTLGRDSVTAVVREFHGIVVVDEAYIHFAASPSFVSEISNLPNLVVLQTLSKAWGLAAARIGLVFANEAVVELLDRIKPPYNVGGLSQAAAIEALNHADVIKEWIAECRAERGRLAQTLSEFGCVERVFQSDANFLLVRFSDPRPIYRRLLEDGIVVRDRSGLPGCERCLRITIGTPDENLRLVESISRADIKNP